MRLSTLLLLVTFATTPLIAQSSLAPDAMPFARATDGAGSVPQQPPPNVRLELTITDTYTGQPSSKTVTMLMETGKNSMIRTSNRLPSGAVVNLNVDAIATVLSAGGIRAQVTFQYTPAQVVETAQGAAVPSSRPAELNESLWVVLTDGQKTMVSESADPATDRKVTVELTATRQ